MPKNGSLPRTSETSKIGCLRQPAVARAFLRCAQDRLCPCARPGWPCHNLRRAGADPRILGSAMSRRDTCWRRPALDCGGLPPPSPPKLASAEGKREQAPALQSWRSWVAPTLVFMSATRRQCKSPQGADTEINVCATPAMPLHQMLPCFSDGCLRPSCGPEPVTARVKRRFKDRLQDLEHRLLNPPVHHVGYP